MGQVASLEACCGTRAMEGLDAPACPSRPISGLGDQYVTLCVPFVRASERVCGLFLLQAMDMRIEQAFIAAGVFPGDASKYAAFSLLCKNSRQRAPSVEWPDAAPIHPI